MKSFILITFGLLGFAFYEMSDGADFDKTALRMSRVDPAPEQTKTQVARVQPTAPAADTTPSEVSRSTITLASLETTTTGNRVTAVLQPAVVTAAQTVTTEAAPKIILPSLIVSNDQPAAVAVQTSAAEETQAIIRTISGNRVNVRGGPGTNFDVVNRMVKGQEVEILSDPGDGWVKMRAVDDGSEGWLADFLLNES